MSFDDWGSPAPNRGNAGPAQPQRGYQVADSESQFATQTQNIEGNLHKLNTNVSNMVKMLELLGGPRDSHDLRQQFTSMKNVILGSFRSVERDILNLPASNPRQINQREQLARRFQGICGQFRQCCEAAAQKEKRAIAAQREREKVTAYNNSADYDDDGEQTSMMAASRREEAERQQQLRTQVRFNQDMIVEREEGMKEIESAVTEINDIFRDLSLAVQDQGQMLDSIEANMTSADTHVERGTNQLVKASDYQKKARSKMLCLLVIVAVVAAILVIVLVTQLRK